MEPDRDTPEWAALFVWRALCVDGFERANLGGMWLPQWSARFDRSAILEDFEGLDRPGLRGRLEGPKDRPDVRYAAIIEGEESIDNRLVEDRRVVRWLTLKYVPELQFWTLADYGPNIIQPDELP